MGTDSFNISAERKQKILILCTGNSCRSQMAEGLLRHFGSDRFEAFSAGTHPTTVNPRAIRAMAEIGIDISSSKSQSVDEFVNEQFDYVITVCDSARESCPVFPYARNDLHWSFEDPADATGSDEEVMAVFHKVRDEIKERFLSYFGLG